mmetsp:Transcript_44470/g.72054  ORF Transcript_44470/g.72054 Transcript_44470/m.72054 type:complete len:215 (+) Transcript_44470:208-852(+)
MKPVPCKVPAQVVVELLRHAILKGVPRQEPAVGRLERATVTWVREHSLEGGPLRPCEGHGLRKDEPLGVLVAAGSCQAPVVAVEVASKCWAQGPHQVQRLLSLHEVVHLQHLLRQVELLQKQAFLTDVEQERGDQRELLFQGSLNGRHVLLPEVDHLQLGCILLAVDEVLRRHTEVNLSDGVILRETVGAVKSNVAHLVVFNLQAVASVQDTEA